MSDEKSQMRPAEKRFRQLQWWAVWLALSSIEAALLYKLIAGQSPVSSTEIIAAVSLVGVFLALLTRLEGQSLISVTPKGVRVELAALQERVLQTEQAIADFVLLSMGPDTLKNLEKIANKQFDDFTMPHGEGLETELYYLRNLGYIEFIPKNFLRDKGVESIHRIPADGKNPDDGTSLNLVDFVRITKRGRDYLKLREAHD